MMYSECCGVVIVDDIAGLELCPKCWEHCDVVFENEDMVAAREEMENMSMDEYNNLPLYRRD
jgi:hypothetical protein